MLFLEEESEEKDTKEKDKLGQGQVQRHRRAESELKREPEVNSLSPCMQCAVIHIEPNLRLTIINLLLTPPRD